MKTASEIIEKHNYSNDCTPNYIDEIESLMHEYSHEVITDADIGILKEALKGLEELENFQNGWEKDCKKLSDLIFKLENLPI